MNILVGGGFYRADGEFGKMIILRREFSNAVKA